MFLTGLLVGAAVTSGLWLFGGKLVALVKSKLGGE